MREVRSDINATGSLIDEPALTLYLHVLARVQLATEAINSESTRADLNRSLGCAWPAMEWFCVRGAAVCWIAIQDGLVRGGGMDG